jgi:hypothetical protein
MPNNHPRLWPNKWIASENAKLADLHDHYHALGVLQARWNVAELQIQRVCWFLMGAGPEVGAAVTFDMGNVARTNLMVTLAREVIKQPDALALFERLEKLFNRHREDRNFLLHCRVMFVSNPRAANYVAVFQAFHADRRFRHPMYVVPIEELRRVADDIQAMNHFFERFFEFLEADGSADRLPSLDMPPRPHSLAQRLRSFAPSDSPQPRSSRGSRKPPRDRSGDAS